MKVLFILQYKYKHTSYLCFRGVDKSKVVGPYFTQTNSIWIVPHFIQMNPLWLGPHFTQMNTIWVGLPCTQLYPIWVGPQVTQLNPIWVAPPCTQLKPIWVVRYGPRIDLGCKNIWAPYGLTLLGPILRPRYSP